MQVNNLKGRVRHTQIWVRTLSVLPAVGFWAYPWIFLCQTLLWNGFHHNTLELCAMWGSIFLRTVYFEQKKSTLGKLSKIVFLERCWALTISMRIWRIRLGNGVDLTHFWGLRSRKDRNSFVTATLVQWCAIKLSRILPLSGSLILIEILEKEHLIGLDWVTGHFSFRSRENLWLQFLVFSELLLCFGHTTQHVKPQSPDEGLNCASCIGSVAS